MARQIIMLETRKGGDGLTQVSGFNWFPIAQATAKIPKPGFVSLGNLLAGPAAITPAEQAALEDGSTREESLSVSYATSTTKAQIQADLVRRYNDRAAAIAAEPLTRQFYGVSFDGTVWSA